MKDLKEYIINEAELFASNVNDIKKQLLKMNKGDRLRVLWGVRHKITDATGKDRMVDYAASIDKVSDDKYTLCSDFSFRGHDLFREACHAAKVLSFWDSISGLAIRLDYEKLCKVLDVMPKFFKDKKYVGDNSIWTFISFDKEECEKECEAQRRPFAITSLEDEIKGIEKGIKELEAKKAQLQELKNAENNEAAWKEENK